MLIATRTACLGGWVTQAKLGMSPEYYNQQKVRVDMFLDIINGAAQKPRFSKLEEILVRKDMGGVYHQSEKLEWLSLSRKPDYLIIDNYSELTDKKFIHKTEKWMFCGQFGDFNIEKLLYQFDCHDLLNTDQIFNKYRLFFEYIKNKWDCPIIFIHFPTTFDTREEYIKQGIAITDAIAQLAPIYGIQNIHADPEAIEQKDSDIYHFTDKTVQNMAAKIKI